MLLDVVTPNLTEVNGTVNQLTESSIKLAEAAANFGALKVIFGIFLVFMLIMMVGFFWQLFSTQKTVQNIYTTTAKVEKYMEDSSNKTLGKGQTSILIRRAFNSLAQTVKYTILRTRIENHIDQTEATHAKLIRIANYEYAELVSFLTNFECDGVDLSSILHSDDAQIIADFMIEQVYLSPEIFTVSGMDQATNILLNGIKLEALKEFK